nr:2-amino-4-hydroxy-6-hydroxymethyldihydropteridine diphosphokinase [uncultured Roseobacter sp.]
MALVALGSNRASREGTPAQAVLAAIAALGRRVGVIRAQSPLYRTPAFPPGSGTDFVNAVVSLETTLAPGAVIAALHEIEEGMGRTRQERWAARTLDLDLLAMDDMLLPDPQTHAAWRSLPLADQMARAPEQLILPHPRLHERAFVLVPLVDVAADWVHPALGLTARQLCEALPAHALSGVTPLPDAAA